MPQRLAQVNLSADPTPKITLGPYVSSFILHADEGSFAAVFFAVDHDGPFIFNTGPRQVMVSVFPEEHRVPDEFWLEYGGKVVGTGTCLLAPPTP
jgi:hypothetical protein